MKSMVRCGVLLLLAAMPALGQNSRFDQIATTTAGAGTAVPLLAIPGVTVTFYNAPAMTLANTYPSASSTTPCPQNAQVVPQGTSSCVATADVQGNFGAWLAAGQYAYTFRYAGQTFGPYSFTIGGGSGSGSVTSVGLAAPGYFTVTGSPVTGAGTLTIAGATGLTVHQVLGTGTVGTLGLETLGTGDLPFTYTGNTTKLATSTGTLATNDYGSFDASGNLVDSGFVKGTATSISGVTISGTPSAGQCPVATSGSAASWASCGTSGGGIPTTPTNALVKINGSNGAASAVSDNGTTVASTEPFTAPSVASGTPSTGASAALPSGAHGFACDETSTAGVPAAGVDYLRCSSAHVIVQSLNGGAETPLGGASPVGANAVQGSNAGATALAATNPATILNGIPVAEYSNTTRTAMANWLQALHNAATVPVNLAIGYDSFSVVCQANYSTGPATCADRYAEQLRIALQGQYGSHGTGIVPVIGSFNGSSTAIPNNLAWTVSGTYDTATISLGPTQSSQGGLVHLHSGAVAIFSDSRGITFDTLKVYCMTNSSSGSIAVSIDSGAETGTACGTTSGSPTAVLFSLSAGSNATHTVTFTSTGDSYLYAAQGTAGSSGVEVSNLAISGALASAFGATPTSELAFSDLNPTGTQGTIIMGQTNDAAASVTPSTFSTQMTSFITHQQGLGSSVMLAVPPPNSGDTGLTAPYTAVQVALAQTANVGFVNIQDQANWGTTYTASNLWSISGDAYPGIHPSNKGALSFFSMIYPTLVDTPPSGVYTPSAGGCTVNCTIGTASNSLTALTVNGGNAAPALAMTSTNNNAGFTLFAPLSANGFILNELGVSNTAHNVFYQLWHNTANPYGTACDTYSSGDPCSLAGSQQWLSGPVYIGNSNANGGATLPSGCPGLSIGTANQICFDLAGNENTNGSIASSSTSGSISIGASGTYTGLLSTEIVGANATVNKFTISSLTGLGTFVNLAATSLGSSPSPLCTTTGGQITNSGCLNVGSYSNTSWNIQPVLFATNTMLGGVAYTNYIASSAGVFTVRLSGTISCTVAPVVNLMDLGTSPTTAYGSATSIVALTTGTTDGVYSTTSGGSVTAGHYYGIAFSAGTCATAPTFDIISYNFW